VNTYLIVIVRDKDEAATAGGSEVVEFRVLAGASADDAKAAVKDITDRRPLYDAFTIKM